MPKALVRALLPIIAVFMTYLMTPGAFELTEHAVHLIGHGDTAHADGDHTDDGASDEHGCSGPYHFCTCHHSVTFIPAASDDNPATKVDAGMMAETGPTSAVDSGYTDEVYRPPQA